jgi:lysophospholipase L1-like esterase
MHPNAAGIDRMVERFLPAVEKLIAADPDNS